jgi:hypothetical protein
VYSRAGTEGGDEAVFDDDAQHPPRSSTETQYLTGPYIFY